MCYFTLFFVLFIVLCFIICFIAVCVLLFHGSPYGSVCVSCFLLRSTLSLDSFDCCNLVVSFMLRNKLHNCNFGTSVIMILAVLKIKLGYVCDIMARTMEEKILRFLPYYSLFNPIEHMWHKVRFRVRSEKLSSMLNA